jgi:HemK-related putative methylase
MKSLTTLQFNKIQENHQANLLRHSSFSTYTINGLKIDAPPNVYHPEPDSSTLFLLKAILENCQHLKNKKKIRILEIGCGTGTIGLSLSEHASELYLSDINPNAVSCTRLNALRNGIEANIFHSDLFASLPDILFDLIIFNIPFLNKKIETVVEVATNDLDGQILLNFMNQLPRYLDPKGEAFCTYSNLGNIEIFEKIPQCLTSEIIDCEHDQETGFERYVFQMKMR